MTEWSYTVKIWAIRKRDYRKPYQLRWKVGKRPHSESFLTSGLAESRRAQLITAAREGEPFDVDSGMPKSLVTKERDISWYEHARKYIEMKWPHAPGSTRRTLAEAMASVAPALVKDTKGMADPRTVRTALYSWAFNMNRWEQEPPAEVAKVLAWFERKSLPASALSDPMRVRAALDALTKKLDGKTAAATTIRRKRAIFHNALGYAVDAGLLTDNPLPHVQWKAPEQVEEEVDPTCVPDPGQAAKLLAAVRDQSPRGRRLVAFFGCMYYAAARPAEVIGLRVQDCDLPRRGWGVLRLRETRPRSGSAWTDSGDAHDKRGLKHRPRKAVRPVPIPPELVALLRWHVTAYGVAPDGRLFRTQRGGLIQDTGYGEVWAEARSRALTPAQRESLLAKRPYDLRHAAVSTWLSSGVEPQLVAKRAGHSVAVLFRVYAKFLSDGDEAANAKISARLGQHS
ncbi:tyrosine-type recombinase/integrase [Streptomyces sp. Je 1-4]|uniref:tyrosine-type recombinase/integrase n=1 Tax=Streptomyces TaxID=1883 RepID=UPI0021D89A29|nr:MULTISPECIES: tyrosine-type recombinase/integrase [unclassified Streptomyces]UYB41691.1 tyrosine-type recombinase/integrase [Streptomyces sp. Je 1-4]UZQ37948.1 tyrosine-type recombinase/integrase [Streptomyces sp. Je 1-4] [Streptomyces sp. Je 1-4 4N24]UZQ45365.1 tyrosine-type recombinase/integrase [Streptomyces sp. Je 1-4] [Streptomyces sp. Je 1-4 4N24_ara]